MRDKYKDQAMITSRVAQRDKFAVVSLRTPNPLNLKTVLHWLRIEPKELALLCSIISIGTCKLRREGETGVRGWIYITKAFQMGLAGTKQADKWGEDAQHNSRE